MNDDYKTKRNDRISQSFIKTFISLSQEKVGDIFDAYLSIPIYINESNRGIDKFNILW